MKKGFLRDAPRADTAKRIVLAESPRRLDITTAWNQVLILVGGAVLLGDVIAQKRVSRRQQPAELKGQER